MKNFKWFLCLIFVLTSNVPVFAQDQVVDRIAAVVNGQIITLYDINEKMGPVLERYKGKKLTSEDVKRLEAMRKQVMEQMISEMLMEEEAKNLNISITDVELENEVRRFKERNQMSDNDFDRQLAAMKMTKRDFSDKMRKDILKHRLLGYKVRSKVVVNEEEVHEAFDKNKQDFSQDRKVHLKLILMPQGMSAETPLGKIKAGEMTFEEAADRYTVGPGSGQGGDIGTLKWEDLAPDWKTAITGLGQGEVSEPFMVNDMEALLFVAGYDSSDDVDFDSVKDAIYNKLYSEKMDKLFQEYMTKLRAKAVIERKL